MNSSHQIFAMNSQMVIKGEYVSFLGSGDAAILLSHILSETNFGETEVAMFSSQIMSKTYLSEKSLREAKKVIKRKAKFVTIEDRGIPIRTYYSVSKEGFISFQEDAIDAAVKAVKRDSSKAEHQLEVYNNRVKINGGNTYDRKRK